MKIVAGISPVLFHITSTYNTASILTKDRFELKPSEGTNIEEGIRQGVYYLSTARTLMSKYLTANEYPGYSILVLDGRKLASNLKGSPVDYWGPSMRNNGANFESEDRIFSASPFIKSAHSFITAIHSMLEKDQSFKQKERGTLFRLELKAKLHKIPTFYYTDRKSFSLLDTRKAVPLDLSVLDPSTPKSTSYQSNSLSDWLALWEMPKAVYDKLAALPEKARTAKGLTDRMVRYVNMVSYYHNDVQSFLADLHNAKSVPYDTPSKEREALDRIIQIMRKNKMNPKDFYKHLGDKFRNT